MAAFIEPAKAKKATAVKLKDMDLHDMIDLGHVHILRVWAGWIYLIREGGKFTTSVFVPQKGNIKEEYE